MVGGEVRQTQCALSRCVDSHVAVEQRALTSIARPVAPAWRNFSQEQGIAVLPPVPCAGPQNRLFPWAAPPGSVWSSVQPRR